MIGELVGGTKESMLHISVLQNHKCSHAPPTQACTPADSEIRLTTSHDSFTENAEDQTQTLV